MINLPKTFWFAVMFADYIEKKTVLSLSSDLHGFHKFKKLQGNKNSANIMLLFWIFVGFSMHVVSFLNNH